jgi:hypothetical protein
MRLPETHTKRQATQHGCLPSLLGDGNKGIAIVYGEEKKNYCTGPTKAAKAKQNLLHHGTTSPMNQPTKKGFLSFVIFESPFTSVSTVSRGHPSLVSLETPLEINIPYDSTEKNLSLQNLSYILCTYFCRASRVMLASACV